MMSKVNDQRQVRETGGRSKHKENTRHEQEQVKKLMTKAGCKVATKARLQVLMATAIESCHRNHVNLDTSHFASAHGNCHRELSTNNFTSQVNELALGALPIF